MARSYRRLTIDEKIEKQKEAVLKAKDKYDAELQALENLMQKRDELRNKELLKAIETSNKSFEDIMQFLADDDNES